MNLKMTMRKFYIMDGGIGQKIGNTQQKVSLAIEHVDGAAPAFTGNYVLAVEAEELEMKQFAAEAEIKQLLTEVVELRAEIQSSALYRDLVRNEIDRLHEADPEGEGGLCSI